MSERFQKLKILFLNRDDVFQRPGGDTVQMMKTKEGLQKLGASVDIAGTEAHDFSTYDLVHLFNIQSPAPFVPVIKAAQQAGKKIALSTIYWNVDRLIIEDYYSSAKFRWPRRLLPNAVSDQMLKWYLAKNHRLQSTLLEQADMLLPNSQAEANKLQSDFDLTNKHIEIIPNAIDPDEFQPTDAFAFTRLYGVTSYVLCVARIQRAKNQLRLIQACKTLKVPLVLVGNIGEPEYFEECRRAAADTDILFLPFQNRQELKAAYAGAVCHVLPSFRETPGLSSLEAAACGIPIVSGTEGSQQEYFGQDAIYCEPSSILSISQAIQTAIHQPKQKIEHLRQRILENYTWAITAEKTMRAYQKITT